MKSWYESMIERYDTLANQEMINGDIKKFMEYQKEANTYREMLKRFTSRSGN